MNKRVCVTDLDGTLLHSQRRISERNLETLHTLGEMGITRVLATGRSLWSLRQVIADDTPFDYAIISTGAGIMDWREQKLIHCANIRPPEICKVFSVLEELDLDYMLHRGVPDTHLMDYREKQGCSDFWKRIEYHRDFARELDPGKIDQYEEVTLFLVIADHMRDDVYPQMKEYLAPLTVINTTSPIDLRSHWIEVLGQDVNKGSALNLLLKMLGIIPAACMVIGNDFNDLDMLDLVPHSYAPNNSSPYLLERYTPVSHHDEDGFSEAVKHWLEKV
ncbi:MAG: HAD family phosphatase [Candidatus Cloacimonetes bacterium]|mgnify:FL=1|nr:HAD family phosphatase [Candidatus Cloacimonadota bacterium]HPI26592.1 HAD family hydrolase [Candidatus Cloacimonadota bacterium]